jgi:hypothetical protein
MMTLAYSKVHLLMRSAILGPSKIAYYERGDVSTYIGIVRNGADVRLLVALANSVDEAAEMMGKEGMVVGIESLHKHLNHIESIQLEATVPLETEFLQ